MHARERERERARPSCGTSEIVLTNTRTQRHMSFRTDTIHAHTRTHDAYDGGSTHSTLSAACRRREDKDGDSCAEWEKRREDVREERGENGGETRKKLNGNREERDFRTIVELVSRPIHKRLFFSVLPKISLFFSPFFLQNAARLFAFADATKSRNSCRHRILQNEQTILHLFLYN